MIEPITLKHKSTKPTSFYVNREAILTFENEDAWLFVNNRWMRFQGRFARTIEDAAKSGEINGDLELLATTGLPGAERLPEIITSDIKRPLSSDLNVAEPSVLFVELTDRCNLSCSHCYAGAGPTSEKFLPEEMALSLVNDAGKMGYRRVQLTGGEPLLHPAIGKIIRAASESGVGEVEIFTNGNYINEEFLTELPGETSFALSFYCRDLMIHDRITGVEGSGKSTLDAIDLLVDKGFACRVATVMMKENSELWEETRQFLIDRGVASGRVDQGSMSKVGRGDFFPKKRETGDVEAKQERCNDDGEEEDLFSWPGKACVSVDGDVSPCIFARWIKLGNIHHRPLGDILKSPDPFKGELLEVPKRWQYCAERLSCPDCRFLVFGLMGGRNG